MQRATRSIPDMKRYTLDLQDFRHLIRGGTLEVKSESGEPVQLALADVGFILMTAEIHMAANFSENCLLGEVREVGEKQ